jgi:hypothetical protein
MVAPGDRPIRSGEQDLLGRLTFAEGLAHQLIATSAEGSVTALVGPWGTGKTSLLNLVGAELGKRGIPVVEFNPWLFSGTDELLERFFEAMLSAIGRDGNSGSGRVRERIRAYADAVTPLGPLPVIGPWLLRAGLATKALTSVVGSGGPRDIHTRRPANPTSHSNWHAA